MNWWWFDYADYDGDDNDGGVNCDGDGDDDGDGVNRDGDGDSDGDDDDEDLCKTIHLRGVCRRWKSGRSWNADSNLAI